MPSTDQKHQETLSFRVGADLKAQFVEACRANDLEVPALLRTLVRAAVLCHNQTEWIPADLIIRQRSHPTAYHQPEPQELMAAERDPYYDPEAVIARSEKPLERPSPVPPLRSDQAS